MTTEMTTGTTAGKAGTTTPILIFDTTLRDGEQSPGAAMTHRRKTRRSPNCWTRWASM